MNDNSPAITLIIGILMAIALSAGLLFFAALTPMPPPIPLSL